LGGVYKGQHKDPVASYCMQGRHIESELHPQYSCTICKVYRK